MPVICLTTPIKAPARVCFDLSRNVDVHVKSMLRYGEQAIGGVCSGLMGLNQTVTWRARHFGLPFKMTVKITEMQQPQYFADAMVSGPFKWFRHYHAFQPQGNYTLMTDEFVFRSPLGWLGKLTDKWILKPYLTRLLLHRNQIIKQMAETGPYN